MTGITVRCKFRLTAVKTSLYWNGKKLYDLHFQPVSDTTPENKVFWEATPTGEFHFGTVNEDAARAFEFGRDYFVDFTPAP